MIGKIAVLAAIVAVLLYLPAAVLLLLVAQFTGISFQAFITFGGVFNTFSGLLTWWLVAFAASCVYASMAFPWEVVQRR